LFIVDEILEQDGIIEIAGIARPEDPNNASLALSPAMSTNSVTATSMLRYSAQPESVYQIEDAASYNGGFSWRPSRSGSYPPPETTGLPEQPELFIELIKFVTQQANHIEALPNVRSYVEASRDSDIIFDHQLAVESDHPGRALRKIGAVGELFVSCCNSRDFKK
jgi:hypothetical protein